MKDRNAEVLSYKDMQTAKRMLSALSSDLRDYNRTKGYSLESDIRDLKRTLVNIRQAMRDRSDDLLQSVNNFAQREEKKIAAHLQSLCVKRKFNLEVKIGGANTGACEYRAPINRYSKATVIFYVGHMWERNVWKNIYQNQRLVQNDYIILSATEYRVNVPHIRLYEARAYGTSEKTLVNGWIGQSKLGAQICSFRTDKVGAIQAAQRLTLGSVNQQLSGETSHD